jgi:hypothetical protein
MKEKKVPENATVVVDTTNNTPVQETGDLEGQSHDTGIQSTAHRIQTLTMGTDREDVTMDGIETGTPQKNSDETREETGLSPKRTKTMRIEKPGEQLHERIRSVKRRVPHKNGKS